jgi:hypothetical protein
MTKLETIRHLIAKNDPEIMEIVIKSIMETWSDEKLLNAWNHEDQINLKGIRLVMIGNEFVCEFYVPLSDFFREAWMNTLNN